MNVLRSMDELLRKPDSALTTHPFALLAGAIGCYLLYGAATGFFQGGWAVALAVTKVPLIVLGSTLVCLPSLYVFLGLAGADFSPRAFAATVAGFCGITGLILLALMPVIWLFSVSTISITFVVLMHLMVWIIALWFGRAFLRRTAAAGTRVVDVWLFLLFLVSLQMTTYVRPVLWREPGQPFIDSRKESFFGHFHDVSEWRAPANPAPAGAPSR
jgi:hypothetical protein